MGKVYRVFLHLSNPFPWGQGSGKPEKMEKNGVSIGITDGCHMLRYISVSRNVCMHTICPIGERIWDQLWLPYFAGGEIYNVKATALSRQNAALFRANEKRLRVNGRKRERRDSRSLREERRHWEKGKRGGG